MIHTPFEETAHDRTEGTIFDVDYGHRAVRRCHHNEILRSVDHVCAAIIENSKDLADVDICLDQSAIGDAFDKENVVIVRINKKITEGDGRRGDLNATGIGKAKNAREVLASRARLVRAVHS